MHTFSFILEPRKLVANPVTVSNATKHGYIKILDIFMNPPHQMPFWATMERGQRARKLLPQGLCTCSSCCSSMKFPPLLHTCHMKMFTLQWGLAWLSYKIKPSISILSIPYPPYFALIFSIVLSIWHTMYPLVHLFIVYLLSHQKERYFAGFVHCCIP